MANIIFFVFLQMTFNSPRQAECGNLAITRRELGGN